MIVDSNPDEALEKLDSVSKMIRLIAAELRQLSSDIESLPVFSDGQLTKEQIVQLQKIDFCSQKLMDFASMADKLASDQNLESLKPIDSVDKVVKLEYTKALLQ